MDADDGWMDGESFKVGIDGKLMIEVQKEEWTMNQWYKGGCKGGY